MNGKLYHEGADAAAGHSQRCTGWDSGTSPDSSPSPTHISWLLGTLLKLVVPNLCPLGMRGHEAALQILAKRDLNPGFSPGQPCDHFRASSCIQQRRWQVSLLGLSVVRGEGGKHLGTTQPSCAILIICLLLLLLISRFSHVQLCATP